MSVRLVSEQAEAAASRVAAAESRGRAAVVGVAARVRLLALELAKHSGPNEMLTTKQISAVKELLVQCNDMLKQFVTEHRNIHVFISRLGKSIDRNFISDISPAAPRDDIFMTPHLHSLVDQSILLHLYRHGFTDVADTLIKEAGINKPEKANELLEFHHVIEAFKQRNPHPALEWLQSRSNGENYSESMFKLHRLIFRNVTANQGHVAAIKYAQDNFPQYANQHKQELQRTMCLLVYESGLLPSSYISLNDEVLWNDCLDTFLRDASLILNYPSTSPIESIIDIGTTAVPKLLEIHDILTQTHGIHTWKTREELPIAMVKGDHSIFACPILRQQSTDENPPVKLICGHVISREALDKLCRNSRLKCPYCPTDQNRSDAKVIYF